MYNKLSIFFSFLSTYVFVLVLVAMETTDRFFRYSINLVDLVIMPVGGICGTTQSRLNISLYIYH